MENVVAFVEAHYYCSAGNNAPNGVNGLLGENYIGNTNRLQSILPQTAVFGIYVHSLEVCLFHALAPMLEV